MKDHIARVLCRAAAASHHPGAHCPICGWDSGACEMWPTFLDEAAATIEAVKDWARLDKRNHPNPRDPLVIVQKIRAAA